MKNIYMLMIALLIGAGAYAQLSRSEQAINPLAPGSMPSYPHSAAGSGPTNLWLEYDSADAYIYNTPQIHTIQWVMNSRYPAGFAHNPIYSSFQYYIVKFDSLYDLYTNNTTPNDSVNSILVDSLYTLIGHQNTSGTTDTLVLKILGLSYPAMYSFPNRADVLWSDTIFTNVSLSPGGSWQSPVRITWKPNFFKAISGFAVELDYYGSFADTCAFVDGFANNGSSGACAYTANLSNFYPQSFAAWTDYLAQLPIVPDSLGDDIFQDCNQDGTFDTGDGYNFLQDIVAGAYITINAPVGIEELKNTGLALSQNIPNPLHNITDIRYELANDVKDVTLYVYDIVGSKVMEVIEGSRTQGKHSILLDATKLAKGIYTYTLNADGIRLTRRMVVE